MGAGGFNVYRKLDPIQGRGPRLYVLETERAETDREILTATAYCKSDNYLAVAFGVDERRVARIRASAPKQREVPHAHGVGVDCGRIGPEVDHDFRHAVTCASDNLRNRILKLFERRAKRGRMTLNEAAFSMGMRP